MHRHHRLVVDDETLRRLYLEEGKSLADIGRLYGKHPNQIRRWLMQAAIPVRSVREGTILSGKYGVHSEAHRESLRENIATARENITPESRAKQSAARKRLGLGGHNKGVPWTPEQREKHMAVRATEEYKQNLSASLRGEKSPSWKGGAKPELDARLDRYEWRRLRKLVYERDNWTCQDCGTKCLNTADSKPHPKRKIQAHHVIPRRHGGRDEPENLVTLCMSCHHKRERAADAALFA